MVQEARPNTHTLLIASPWLAWNLEFAVETRLAPTQEICIPLAPSTGIQACTSDPAQVTSLNGSKGPHSFWGMWHDFCLSLYFDLSPVFSLPFFLSLCLLCAVHIVYSLLLHPMGYSDCHIPHFAVIHLPDGLTNVLGKCLDLWLFLQNGYVSNFHGGMCHFRQLVSNPGP